MLRKKFLLLAATGLLLASSIPAAQAASIAECRSQQEVLADGTVTTEINANAQDYMLRLRHRGLNVDYVEDWGGCVKASVTDPNGHSHFLFFDPDTLQQLTTN